MVYKTAGSRKTDRVVERRTPVKFEIMPLVGETKNDGGPTVLGLCQERRTLAMGKKRRTKNEND